MPPTLIFSFVRILYRPELELNDHAQTHQLYSLAGNINFSYLIQYDPWHARLSLVDSGVLNILHHLFDRVSKYSMRATLENISI